MITALVRKDLKLYFRNPFYVVITILGLAIYLILYALLPSKGEDAYTIALYVEDPTATTVDEAIAGSVAYTLYPSEEALRKVVEEDSNTFVGIAISAEQAEAIASGAATTVDVFYAPDIPTTIKAGFDDVVTLVINSANPAIRAQFGQFTETRTVLGNDIYDSQISPRDRMVPVLIFFILSIEVLGLATLIQQEVETGTARALVTSPLRLSQFFAGKVIMGVLLAFGELLVLTTLTGKIATSPLLLLTTLLLGAFMITGFGFLVAAISRDSMSVVAWGTLFLVVFMIPSIVMLLPGLASGWVEAIPSFYLIDSLHRILNFGATWGDVGRDLATSFGIGVVALALGSTVLSRRFQR